MIEVSETTRKLGLVEGGVWETDYMESLVLDMAVIWASHLGDTPSDDLIPSEVVEFYIGVSKEIYCILRVPHQLEH